MDLFTPLVPLERLHPNFVHALKATPEDRAVLSEWADGFIDRDGKFVREFQTTFNSSFWELYLFAALKERGHCVDFSFHAPDFVVTGPATPFCMEATSANNAAKSPPEWAATLQGLLDLDDRGPVVREATIRLANAVSSKLDKYSRSYAALPHVADRPFALAIVAVRATAFSRSEHASNSACPVRPGRDAVRSRSGRARQHACRARRRIFRLLVDPECEW